MNKSTGLVSVIMDFRGQFYVPGRLIMVQTSKLLFMGTEWAELFFNT